MYFISYSLLQTHVIANKILKKYFKKSKIFFLLYGDLGSGKTEFIKGIASALNIPPKKIKSPSFIIANEIEQKKLILYHIDLYRIEKKQAENFIHSYIEELPNKKKIICCIEWSEKLTNNLIKVIKTFEDTKVVKIKIKIEKNNVRKIFIKPL